jgi:hypothetical protein
MAQAELKAPLKAGRLCQTAALAAGFPMGMHHHLVACPMMIIVVVCLCRCNSTEGNGGGYGGQEGLSSWHFLFVAEPWRSAAAAIAAH